METYLETALPDDLCKHLFLSFMKKATLTGAAALAGVPGKDLSVKDMAVVASQTICAPLSTELPFDPRGGGSTPSGEQRHHSGGLAEKIAGLTDKLHILGHSRSDSANISGDSGRRSRAGDNLVTPDQHENDLRITSVYDLYI